MNLDENKKTILVDTIETMVNISVEKMMFTSDLALQYLRSNFAFNESYKLKFIINDNYIKYLESHYNQFKLLLYILFNINKLNIDDINEVSDAMFDDMNAVFAYTYDMIDSFTNAINMQANYRFELPHYKIESFNNNDYKDYLTYLKGYNVDSIANFLTDYAKVYDQEQCEQEIDNLKIVDVNKKEYEFFSGINDKGNIMVPRIKDSKSTLILVHELIHKYLLLNKERINNDNIVYGEELPILYEMLYMDYNKLCKCKIHKNEIANKLYNEYDGQDINKQILKLKKILDN